MELLLTPRMFCDLHFIFLTDKMDLQLRCKHCLYSYQVKVKTLISQQVVKSRIQGAEHVPGVTPKYNWTYPALVTIMREEGVAALYKGFVPKVLRLAPGGGVLLLVVEFTLGVFRQGTSFCCMTCDWWDLIRCTLVLGPPYI